MVPFFPYGCPIVTASLIGKPIHSPLNYFGPCDENPLHRSISGSNMSNHIPML